MRRVAATVVVAAATLAGTATAAQAQLPTANDPRVGLSAGITDAGSAIKGLELLSNSAKPAGFGATDSSKLNSDLAFRDNLAFVGNYGGFNIYDISNPAAPVLKTSVLCQGSQGDVSVYKNLLFVSVEATGAKKDCTTEPAATAETRFRGVRIFDITDITKPVQVGQVQTCRGSHTHTLVEGKDDPNSVYIYVQGSAGVRPATELAGCNGGAATTENPSQWRIEVIKVPVANPAAAAIVNEPRLFKNETTGALNGGNSSTNHCHDITVFEEIDLAAGACAGNGLLIDISDPANPKRIDMVADTLFSYWHSATFTNDGKAVVFTDELGGGSGARCRATDPLNRGADGIYEIVDRKLVFRSYYKLPMVQTSQENCVSHNGNLIPVPGRNIMVQAWYQGGTSIVDFTDLSNPKEIAYFDRGPNSATSLVTGGYWSSYWYKGRIYGSEIVRGFDTFKLAPTEHLSAAEIAAAERATTSPNAQTQTKIVYNQEPVTAPPVGGTVPATLALTLGTPGTFGAFTPGVTKTYTAKTEANVISTAGEATLSVSDPGKLANGPFTLAEPLQVAFSKSVWTGPVSNDKVDINFTQLVKDVDPLRTGSYSKSLTFTLSTTTP